MRIYKVTQEGKHRLVRASTQAVARSHVAKSTIEVVVASPDDTYELAQQGVKVEETSTTPVQKEVGE
jgi:mannose/fructose/N-acetylgalactosamine-specific phosphotransferase system component IIB